MGPWGHKKLDTIEHACQCTELARVMQGNINLKKIHKLLLITEGNVVLNLTEI